MAEKVGFIGMGLMGSPMALNLVKAGYEVAVWNRTVSKAEVLARQGGRLAKSPADAARGAAAVFVMVGDTPDVEQVLLGTEGVSHGAEKGAVVVDCSTIAPEAEVKFAAQFEKKGVRYLDAPVTGGQKGAVAGTLSFIVGGESGALEAVRSMMLVMGKKVFHAGGLGCGQKLKIVNQIVCSVNLVSWCEGLSAAKKLGLDQKQAWELLKSGAAGSWSLEVYGEKMLNSDYSPAFSVKWQTKDLRIALETLGENASDLPGLQVAYDRFKKAAQAGYEEEGIQSVFKLYNPKDWC